VEVHRELVTFSKGYHSDLAGYPRFRKKLRTILTMDRGPAPAR